MVDTYSNYRNFYDFTLVQWLTTFTKNNVDDILIIIIQGLLLLSKKENGNNNIIQYTLY